MRVDHVFEDFARIHDTEAKVVAAVQTPTNFECLKFLVEHYEANCGKIQDYDLQYVKYFVQECEKLDGLKGIDAVASRLRKACNH